MKQLLLSHYQKAIETVFKDKSPEAKRYLMHHPKRDSFLERMCFEVKGIRDRGILLTDHELQTLMQDMTRFFSRTALGVKEQELRTEEGKRIKALKEQHEKDQRLERIVSDKMERNEAIDLDDLDEIKELVD